MDAGAKERARYKDIEWLMPSVDLEKVFSKLGIVITDSSGDNLRALCPDHHLFTGHNSSDPNWFINKVNGKTNCYTEGRGSNLVWTVCRLLKKEPDDVAKFLTGKDSLELESLKINAVLIKASKLHEQTTKEGIKVKGLDAIEKDIQNRKMSQRAYDFFIHPPGKKYPTNITKETVDRYNVFERTWGFYKDRIVIPYYMHKSLVGFCAIDLLGKESWSQEHPGQDLKDYKKVRYPTEFKSSECLFGYDDCNVDEEYLVLVEGAREVMKLRQEGIPAVGISGAYLSNEHKILLSKIHPKRFVLMFDGDNAGVDITNRTAKLLEKIYPIERIKKCFIPSGRDPKNLSGQELLDTIHKTS